MHKEELTDGQSLRGFALATIARFWPFSPPRRSRFPSMPTTRPPSGSPRRISPTRCSLTSPAWP
ncbi:MAG: hypothetical protein ACLTDR_05285 [Adlercreutzia equolifaciens]